MKKLIFIVLLTITTYSYTHNVDSPCLINTVTIPLDVIIMYSATEQERATLQPQETFIVPFKPSKNERDIYPDIQVICENDKNLWLTTRNPADDCLTTQYPICRTHELEINRYAQDYTQWEVKNVAGRTSFD